MSILEPKAIAPALKKGEVSNIYYIYGTDVTEVERVTGQIIKAVVGDAEDFALTKLQGRLLDFDSLYDLVQMMPMMSEYNCILINDYNFEKPAENMRGHTADFYNDRLMSIIKEIPPQTVVICNVTGFSVATKYDSKKRDYVISDKNKKLADYAAKNGVVCKCSKRTPQELSKTIANKASARGGMIPVRTAERLAQMCLCDSLRIDNEIEKLCAYAAGREITMEMLDELVHEDSEMTGFKLAAAVASMNSRAAFDAIDEMNIDDKNRMMVLSAVQTTFLDLYRAAIAVNSGVGVDQVVSDFGYYGRKFAVEKAFRDCRKMSVRKYRGCIKILRDINVLLNSSAADPKTVFEEAVTKMLALKN